MCIHSVYAGVQRPEDPPELELQTAVMKVVGTELGSSGGAAMAFVCRVILLEPHYCSSGGSA